MNPVRKKRLIAVLFLVTGAVTATALILYALGENLNHFFTPSQIQAGEAQPNQQIRVGGLVVVGSVSRLSDDLTVTFQLTDNKAGVVDVHFTGILPDLFREGQGIVATGAMNEQAIFIADEVLAKHDENYMPPEAKAAIEGAGHPSSGG